MAALDRFRASAGRLLARYGTDMVIRRKSFTRTRNGTGSDRAQVGADITVRGAIRAYRRFEPQSGLRGGDQRLVLHHSAFAAAPLDKDQWVVVRGTKEIPIDPPITAVEINGSVAYWTGSLTYGASA